MPLVYNLCWVDYTFKYLFFYNFITIYTPPSPVDCIILKMRFTPTKILQPVVDFQEGVGGHLPGPAEKLSIETAAKSKIKGAPAKR